MLSVGDSTYTWGDVFLAARLWGEWDALEEWLRNGLAALEAAPVADADVKQAGEDWRRARRLLAGDELKNWLARKRLSIDDWRAYVARAVALHRAGAGGAATGAVADDVVAGSIWAEGACSGAFEGHAARLAERVAAPAAGAPAPPPPAWFERSPSAAEAEAIGIPAAEVARRVERLWAAEEAHARLCDAVRESDAIRRTVSANTVDWLRLDCELLRVGAEDAAREAVLLVREDGMPLPEVARQAGLELAAERLYLGEMPPELRPRLASAAPGELVGPLATGGEGYLLVAVNDKVVPSLEDPEIRARAENAAIASAVEREVQARVRWHEHP